MGKRNQSIQQKIRNKKEKKKKSNQKTITHTKETGTPPPKTKEIQRGTMEREPILRECPTERERKKREREKEVLPIFSKMGRRKKKEK